MTDKLKNPGDTANVKLERGLSWLRAMAAHGGRKFDRQAAVVLLEGIAELQKERDDLAKVATRMDKELADAASDRADATAFPKQWGTPEQVTFAMGFVKAAKKQGRELCPLHVEFLLTVLERYARHERESVPPKEPSPEWRLRARAEGRAEFLNLLLEQSAETFAEDYTGSHPLGESGDYDLHWKTAELRKLFKVDEPAWSLIDNLASSYWAQEARIMELQEPASASTQTMPRNHEQQGEHCLCGNAWPCPWASPGATPSTEASADAGEELELADPAECCIFANGSGNRCVTHEMTWASGPCPATVPRKASAK